MDFPVGWMLWTFAQTVMFVLHIINTDIITHNLNIHTCLFRRKQFEQPKVEEECLLCVYYGVVMVTPNREHLKVEEEECLLCVYEVFIFIV